MTTGNRDAFKACKSCRSYSILAQEPSCAMRWFSYIPKDPACPCLTCIVKTMCTNQCEDYMNYINLIGSLNDT